MVSWFVLYSALTFGFSICTCDWMWVVIVFFLSLQWSKLNANWKRFVLSLFIKKWFENPGRDNLVSENSLQKLRPLGRLCLSGLHVSCFVDWFWHSCAWAFALHWHWPLGCFGKVFFGSGVFLRWLTVGQLLFQLFSMSFIRAELLSILYSCAECLRVAEIKILFPMLIARRWTITTSTYPRRRFTSRVPIRRSPLFPVSLHGS